MITAGLIIGILLAIIIILAFLWYTIVPQSEAHVVTTPRTTFIASSDPKVAGGNGSRWYFDIPSFIPLIGRVVRMLDITIKELMVAQETIEKGQARFNVNSSTKYRIVDVKKAAETFINNEELKEQLREIIKAAVREVTVQYDVITARAKKQLMSDNIRKSIVDDFNAWGLELVNFQLVDFTDTESSKIISDISRRAEVEIEATTRERNAEKLKQAKIKEAEADEKSKKREIERDRTVGVEQQLKQQKIAEQEKLAREKEYEVKRVEIVKKQDIEKERAIVEANQKKEQELILKEQKRLEGEGDRLKAQEVAKGEAAPIREKGFAEAEAKDKLQAALNKFKDEAIRALVAEKIVAKDEKIGVATAQALEKADLKVFSGGENDKQGFNLGKIISATSTANETSAEAVLNKLARPNDMGFKTLGLLKGQEISTTNKKKKSK